MARRGGARFCGVCGRDTATGARSRLRAYGGSIARLATLAAGLACIPLAAWFGAEARGAAKAGLTSAWAPPAAASEPGAPAAEPGPRPHDREGDSNERVGELLAAWRAPAKAAAPAGRADAGEARPSFGPARTTGAGPARLAPVNVVSSSISMSQRVSYSPWNVVDGDPGTGWQVSNGGPGEWIELRFDHPVTLSRLGVVPGYDKNLPDRVGDRWPLNNRISEAEIAIEGRSFNAHFSDTRPMQWHDLGGAVTRWVRITIVSVYPGARWYDTVISEVQVEGTP